MRQSGRPTRCVRKCPRIAWSKAVLDRHRTPEEGGRRSDPPRPVSLCRNHGPQIHLRAKGGHHRAPLRPRCSDPTSDPFEEGRSRLSLRGRGGLGRMSYGRSESLLAGVDLVGRGQKDAAPRTYPLVADVLLGQRPFTGQLPMSWPRTEAQGADQPGRRRLRPALPVRLGSARAVTAAAHRRLRGSKCWPFERTTWSLISARRLSRLSMPP